MNVTYEFNSGRFKLYIVSVCAPHLVRGDRPYYFPHDLFLNSRHLTRRMNYRQLWLYGPYRLDIGNLSIISQHRFILFFRLRRIILDKHTRKSGRVCERESLLAIVIECRLHSGMVTTSVPGCHELYAYIWVATSAMFVEGSAKILFQLSNSLLFNTFVMEGEAESDFKTPQVVYHSR